MPMKEVTLEYIKARLTALGFTEDDIKKGIEVRLLALRRATQDTFIRWGSQKPLLRWISEQIDGSCRKGLRYSRW